MKAFAWTALLSGITATSFAQKTFIIHGKINLLTKSKAVRLIGYKTAVIQPNGAFELTGEINEPNVALIMTDGSAANAIWLEPGEYHMNCEEIELPDHKGVVFRTPFLKGSANAERFNDFQKQLYSGFGIEPGRDEDPTSRRARQKDHAARYMDSVLKINNSSPVLANMVRSVQHYIGDEVTKMLIQRPTPELRNNGEIETLENDFKRKEKIKNEKKFKNFTLEDVGDGDFSLSALNGRKAILIDFWASSCGPCRAGHPKLREWYTKYAGKGLEIVSISIDDNKDSWLKAVKDDGIGKWINVCDSNGFKASLMQDYYIPYIPFRFLLDGNKNIILVDNAQDSWTRVVPLNETIASDRGMEFRIVSYNGVGLMGGTVLKPNEMVAVSLEATPSKALFYKYFPLEQMGSMKLRKLQLSYGLLNLGDERGTTFSSSEDVEFLLLTRSMFEGIRARLDSLHFSVTMKK